tara:strand:- start:138 stop:2102 length:1965 start_codon:yes stop_codon:yes gene_type:complete
MNNQDLNFISKVKLYHYMQIVKVVLGLVVAIFSIAFLNFGKFDFYIPSLAFSMAISGFIAIFLRSKLDQDFKWSPFVITTLDVCAFIFCIYISDFAFNTIFFWLAGLIAMTYFFTNAKLAIAQLVLTIGFITFWVHSGLYQHSIISTDVSYNDAFFISSIANLLFVFSIFHFSEKIKNKFQASLLRAHSDIEKINSFPLHNPNPIFEYIINEELSPKNKIAREFVLYSENDQLEELIFFSKSILETKTNSSVIIKLDDKEFMVNGAYVKGKVNLYLTDVTELIETKRVFEEREQYNRAIIDAMPGFVSWIDRDYNYLGVNDHMCEFFNKKPSDFIGQTVGEVSGEVNNVISDLVEELFGSDADLLQKEFAFDYDDKKFWSYITLKQYNDGKNAVLVSTDITKLKEAETKVREEQSKAESSAKLAAFGAMAAGIAHEINNPLAILNGIGYRLQKLKEKDKLTDEKFLELTNKLFYGVERITKIINGMKNLSREGVNDAFEFTLLQEIIDESLVLLSKKCIHNSIDLQLPVIPEHFGIDCQRVQISQSLVILINNSIDAITNQIENKWIKIEVSESEEFVTISVSDSGKGISVDVAKRIFEPFYTTKSVGKGTGLGLSLANKIIKSHGGTFTLDQTCPNTKFDMIIPKNVIAKSVS